MGEAGRHVKNSNRRVVVFLTLVSGLTLTSALLLALAPAPLRPDATSSLYAVDAPEAMDVIFHTQNPVKPGRWKYIYVHHSRTPSGDAMTVARGSDSVPDHFVITNGDGAVDGQIQVGQRWDQQVPAMPVGTDGIDPACISICLIGDFDHALPTPTQLRRLTNLVNALQERFDVPAGQVLALSAANSAAGMGKYFPATAFREQLLP
jgi:hypothetical protein